MGGFMWMDCVGEMGLSFNCGGRSREEVELDMRKWPFAGEKVGVSGEATSDEDEFVV